MPRGAVQDLTVFTFPAICVAQAAESIKQWASAGCPLPAHEQSLSCLPPTTVQLCHHHTPDVTTTPGCQWPPNCLLKPPLHSPRQTDLLWHLWTWPSPLLFFFSFPLLFERMCPVVFEIPWTPLFTWNSELSTAWPVRGHQAVWVLSCPPFPPLPWLLIPALAVLPQRFPNCLIQTHQASLGLPTLLVVHVRALPIALSFPPYRCQRDHTSEFSTSDVAFPSFD